jgi:hypothetical protein
MGESMMHVTLRTRWVLATASAAVLAGVLCAVQAVAILRFRDPQPDLIAAVGEPITSAGVIFRLDTFTVAKQLPAKDGAEPLRAMPGAVLVRNVVTVRVDDPARDLTKVYCGFTLVAPDGRQWQPSDDAYQAAGPERVTCASNADLPLAIGRPYEVGTAFEIPAEVSGEVSLRIEQGWQEQNLQFHR